MKKYRVIINITNNFLAFWPGYYTDIRATFLLSLLSLPTKIVAIKIKKNLISQKIIKKDSKKNMTNFLQSLNKLSNKKKNK